MCYYYEGLSEKYGLFTCKLDAGEELVKVK